MRPTTATRLRRLAAWLGLVIVAGCAPPQLARSQQVSAGSPQIGRELVEDYGCITCHNIPGVRSEETWVGPPLDRWGQRRYIAGSLINNQENLVRWITDPQGVEPGTAMPDVGVSRQDAENIAAYLLSIE